LHLFSVNFVVNLVIPNHVVWYVVWIWRKNGSLGPYIPAFTDKKIKKNVEMAERWCCRASGTGERQPVANQVACFENNCVKNVQINPRETLIF
jgi:hypothetical protein